MGNCGEKYATPEPNLERVVATERAGKGYHGRWPYGSREKALWAIKEAEEERGSPAYLPDLRRAINQRYHLIRHSTPFLRGVLMDLYRNDQVLCDREMDRFTLDPAMQHKEGVNETGFELHSDRFTRMFPGYNLTDNGLMEPKEDTPTVNFNHLKELLLSKDLSRGAELEWANTETRFLDRTVDMNGNIISFCSFPRSGNSMLRKYLEGITGIDTGSDHWIEISTTLQLMGLKGEGHCATDNVWVTKSHSPWVPLGATPFKGNKMIFLMRNPIDNIPSLGHLTMLNSHSLTPVEDYSKDEPEWWNMFVNHVTWEMKTFFKVLTEQAIPKIPTYAIRFEDLRQEPERVLTELMCFMLDV